MRGVSRRLGWGPRVGGLLFALAVAAHHTPLFVEAAPTPQLSEAISFDAQLVGGNHADYPPAPADMSSHCDEAIVLASPQVGEKETLSPAARARFASEMRTETALVSALPGVSAQLADPPRAAFLQVFRE